MATEFRAMAHAVIRMWAAGFGIRTLGFWTILSLVITWMISHKLSLDSIPPLILWLFIPENEERKRESKSNFSVLGCVWLTEFWYWTTSFGYLCRPSFGVSVLYWTRHVAHLSLLHFSWWLFINFLIIPMMSLLAVRPYTLLYYACLNEGGQNTCAPHILYLRCRNFIVPNYTEIDYWGA